MPNPHAELGARERQIMDIVYRRGRVAAEEVREDLPDAVTNSTVRGMLRILEGKGYLRHEREGRRFVYLPTADPEQVRRRMLRDLVRTFFSNSASSAVAAMLGEYGGHLTPQELDRLEALIARTRQEGERS